ncbi:MAG TPA: helix-turn-helix transcriptional regulator [Ktedonobacterales bacterium]|nr:helix-turn-helix transcriptional regulator [Ktedonobacterales bacterium]
MPATSEPAISSESVPVTNEAAREKVAGPTLAHEAGETVYDDSQPPPETPGEAEKPSAPDDELHAEEQAYATSVAPRPSRRERQRLPHGNALGILIERTFTDPTSPCRSYSDLERRSGISREALSRYVTARADRRRSPTIDTLVAIAGAMHLSLEAVSRAAAASVHGVIPPPEQEQHSREEVLGTLIAGLTNEQFNAVVELLRHLRPVPPPAR